LAAWNGKQTAAAGGNEAADGENPRYEETEKSTAPAEKG
jgi:hypothetical protein